MEVESAAAPIASVVPLPDNPASTQPDFDAAAAASSTASAKGNKGGKNKNADGPNSKSSKDLYRRVPIPPHRLTPLKQNWMQIYKPLVELMSLVVRFNTRTKAVEIKVRA